MEPIYEALKTMVRERNEKLLEKHELEQRIIEIDFNVKQELLKRGMVELMDVNWSRVRQATRS